MDRKGDEYVVTRNDWETSPMPEKNTQFTIKRKISDEEIERLKKGHLPDDMDDRWLFYHEDGRLYFHRSWSGSCIFIVELNLTTDNHVVTVNRDEDQYTNTDIDEDKELISSLLGWF